MQITLNLDYDDIIQACREYVIDKKGYGDVVNVGDFTAILKYRSNEKIDLHHVDTDIFLQLGIETKKM